MPMDVFTFLEMYDLSGMVIRPFCTNEGSGLGSSVSEIMRLCPGAIVEECLSINGSRVAESRETIERWAKG